MNLSDFTLKIAENPWNAMDTSEAEQFAKNRIKQVQNWRDIVYKNIEFRNHGKSDRIKPENLVPGTIEDGKGTEYYCQDCGTMKTTPDEDCYFCGLDKFNSDKVDKSEKSKKEEK
jgi:hypothetical protein